MCRAAEGVSAKIVVRFTVESFSADGIVIILDLGGSNEYL